ncbi:MAG TPA: Trm112 family protein [Egibacteraceae bacterium]|nr:Trm112 family protein [Egibacteraceae bacterium]
MAVDAGLVELLVCPDCHGAVEYKDRRGLIICTECNLHYPVRDGIPVMLVEEATRPGRRASRDGGS